MKTDELTDKMQSTMVLDAILSENDDRTEHSSKDEQNSKPNTRAVKLTNRQCDILDKIKIMLGTTKDSDALRWCIDNAWEQNEEFIEEYITQLKKLKDLVRTGNK